MKFDEARALEQLYESFPHFDWKAAYKHYETYCVDPLDCKKKLHASVFQALKKNKTQGTVTPIFYKEEYLGKEIDIYPFSSLTPND